MRINYFIRLKLRRDLLLNLSLAIGIILRIAYWLKNRPLEFDEAVVWKVANLHVKDILSGNFFEFRFHPPLFYLFIHYWKYISESEIWLRLPSFIASILSIYLLFIFLKILFNKKVATLGVFLYSTSAFLNQWATQLRIYQILFMVSLLYLLLYVKSFRENKVSYYYLFLFLLAGILGFYMDYSFIWVFITVNIHFLFTNFNSIFKKKTVIWLTTNCLIFINLLFYIAKVGKVTLASHNALTAISAPNLMNVISLLFEFLFSERWTSLWVQQSFLISIFFYLVLLLLVTLAIKESILFRKDKNRLLIALIFWSPLLISLVISQFYPIFVSKNLFIVSLGILVSLAIAIERLSKHRLIFFGLSITWFISNIFIISQFYKDDPQWVETVSFLKNEAVVNSRMLFLPAWFQQTFLYYNHKFNLIDSKQIIYTSFSKQTLNLAIGYQKAGINHCVIYDTYRRFTEENFYQTYPKRWVFSFFESYPKKLDLGGGIKIYCT